MQIDVAVIKRRRYRFGICRRDFQAVVRQMNHAAAARVGGNDKFRARRPAVGDGRARAERDCAASVRVIDFADDVQRSLTSLAAFRDGQNQAAVAARRPERQAARTESELSACIVRRRDVNVARAQVDAERGALRESQRVAQRVKDERAAQSHVVERNQAAEIQVCADSSVGRQCNLRAVDERGLNVVDSVAVNCARERNARVSLRREVQRKIFRHVEDGDAVVHFDGHCARAVNQSAGR